MGKGTGSDYRCVATVQVPAEKADLYDQLLCKSASVFKTHGWRLLVPGQKASIFDTSGPPPGLQRKLLHVWDIPNFDSLPKVMAYAADDPAYVEAQAMTIGETQNLYVILRWDNPIDIPDTPANFYLMETLHMVNGEQAREDFANYMDNAVYKMSSSYSWQILFAGNATTGIINEYVNVWALADTNKLEQAIKEYRGGASWSAAVTRVETSLWTQRPLPCFQDLNAAPATPPRAG